MELPKYQKGYKQDDSRIVYPNGYIGVNINGKWLSEHRYIWEKYHGRKIPKNCAVHHKDGNIQNNNISNLKLVSKEWHKRHHGCKS